MCEERQIWCGEAKTIQPCERQRKQVRLSLVWPNRALLLMCSVAFCCCHVARLLRGRCRGPVTTQH